MGTFLVPQVMKRDSEFRIVSVSFMTKFHEYRGFRQTPGSEKNPVPMQDFKDFEGFCLVNDQRLCLIDDQ
jgi:hypothetical protein